MWIIVVDTYTIWNYLIAWYKNKFLWPGNFPLNVFKLSYIKHYLLGFCTGNVSQRITALDYIVYHTFLFLTCPWSTITVQKQEVMKSIYDHFALISNTRAPISYDIVDVHDGDSTGRKSEHYLYKPVVCCYIFLQYNKIHVLL